MRPGRTAIAAGAARRACCKSRGAPAQPRSRFVTSIIDDPGRCKLYAIRAAWDDRVSETENILADVLVIDDDSVMRELVADWLDAAGYRVCMAVDCQAGLEQAGRARPQLIVTDMHMPGASGATAIARLKQQHPQARIVAISGHFNSGHGLSAAEALAAGAVRAFGKPVKRAEFIDAVAAILGRPE